MQESSPLKAENNVFFLGGAKAHNSWMLPRNQRVKKSPFLLPCCLDGWQMETWLELEKRAQSKDWNAAGFFFAWNSHDHILKYNLSQNAFIYFFSQSPHNKPDCYSYFAHEKPRLLDRKLLAGSHVADTWPRELKPKLPSCPPRLIPFHQTAPTGGQGLLVDLEESLPIVGGYLQKMLLWNSLADRSGHWRGR